MGYYQVINICIMEISEEEIEKRTETLFEEIMTEIFPNLREKIDIQIQEAERTPARIN